MKLAERTSDWVFWPILSCCNYYFFPCMMIKMRNLAYLSLLRWIMWMTLSVFCTLECFLGKVIVPLIEFLTCIALSLFSWNYPTRLLHSRLSFLGNLKYYISYVSRKLDMIPVIENVVFLLTLIILLMIHENLFQFCFWGFPSNMNLMYIVFIILPLGCSGLPVEVDHYDPRKVFWVSVYQFGNTVFFINFNILIMHTGTC